MPKEYSPAILIVDDVAENIQIVAGVLRNEGYNMAFATSGDAALDICKNNDFDLILLDVMMPEMDGFEVCQQLKSDPATADSTIVFLTAKTDVESTVHGFELGGSDYITKPFNAAELLARVKTQLQLRINERKLKQMNQSKDRFISIIAQELKGPFVGLNGVLKMIDDEFDTLEHDMMKDYVGLSRRASDQLLGLIDNLFTWSTMQTEDLPYTPRQIDLAAPLAECVREIAPVMERKKINFTNEISEGAFTFADEEMVRIVIRNLLTNAAMFTEEGGEVHVSAPPDEQCVCIEVSDNGVGITGEDQEKLFRIDRKFKRKGTAGEIGTGMGLIVSKELVEKQGGTITLNSEPGRGTQVTVCLPSHDQENNPEN